jgi:uncharacterized protein YdgA (DUF945 family)
MRAEILQRGLARAGRVASGRIRVPFLIAGFVFVLLVIFVVLPYPLGMRTETVYRDYLAYLRQEGMDARVTSYNRGWFSSDSTTVIVYMGRRLVVKSHISHGPFVLSGTNASIRAVAAAVRSTLDLVPAKNSPFKVASSALHLFEVHAIVHLGDTADISGVLAPFSYSDAAAGQTWSFAGGRWASRIAGIHARTTATIDDFEFSMRDGTLDLGKILVDFHGERDRSGMWLGTVTESIPHCEYRASAKLPNGTTMQFDEHLRDLRIRGRMWRDGSMIHIDDGFSIAHADFGNGQSLSIDFGVRAGNLDPTTIAGWLRRIALMYHTQENAEAMNRQSLREYFALAVALAKNNPHIAVTLNVKGSFGTVAADATGGLKAAMASDPALAKANGSAASWKLVGERYAYGSGGVKVPASLRALIPKGTRSGDWVSEGYIAQQGDYLVSRFKFDDGHLSLNGHQIF